MTRISDPHFAERVHASFALQHAMTLIRATMPVVAHLSLIHNSEPTRPY